MGGVENFQSKSVVDSSGLDATRIAIVEDEAIAALYLEQELTRLGYVVTGTASNSDQALNLIEESSPGLVLMDISLQGEVDGIETAKKIPPGLHLPVVFMTAYSEESILKRVGTDVSFGYLRKPYLDRELHLVLQTTLERAQAEETLRESGVKHMQSL